MSIFYLANVQSIATERGINFYTPHCHVAVYYPRDNSPRYMVWDFSREGTQWQRNGKAFFGTFADAMDKASEWLKRAEPV
jgi:hypothetical protein